MKIAAANNAVNLLHTSLSQIVTQNQTAQVPFQLQTILPTTVIQVAFCLPALLRLTAAADRHRLLSLLFHRSYCYDNIGIDRQRS